MRRILFSSITYLWIIDIFFEFLPNYFLRFMNFFMMKYLSTPQILEWPFSFFKSMTIYSYYYFSKYKSRIFWVNCHQGPSRNSFCHEYFIMISAIHIMDADIFIISNSTRGLCRAQFS